MRFEEIPEQGRYPLLVAHLQGEKAFGSDILSFASAEDRERFKESRNRNLVVRFIEVKGRNSDRGAVLLMDNQYRAASDNRERFYIYRV
jgi:hypothetical protein